jgi:aryl-alcohol dehydrogenase-like predicted oxidoreductase
MATTSVPLQRLGKYGPQVAALGLGLMGLAGAYGAGGSDEDKFEFLDRAVELGATFWDNSEYVSPLSLLGTPLTQISIYGLNDEMLAKWFQRSGKRDQIFFATKFGIQMERGTFNFVGIDSSAEYCKKACAASLERLGIDCIDLCTSRINSIHGNY